MNNEVDINELLVGWGERWDWSPKNRKPKMAKRTKTGLSKLVLGRNRAPMVRWLFRLA